MYFENPFTRQRERLICLVDFYVSLACYLLGGSKSLNMTGFGDVLNHERGLVLEVKGCDNHHFFKIFSEQLDAYLKNKRFPNCWYVLFGYRNSGCRCLGESTPTPSELYKFLAERTVFMCVIDVAILDAIRKVFGTLAFRRRGEAREVVKLNRTLIGKFEAAPVETFKILGIEPALFAVQSRRINVSFSSLPMTFDCVLILPKRMSQKTGKLLFEVGIPAAIST